MFVLCVEVKIEISNRLELVRSDKWENCRKTDESTDEMTVERKKKKKKRIRIGNKKSETFNIHCVTPKFSRFLSEP